MCKGALETKRKKPRKGSGNGHIASHSCVIVWGQNRGKIRLKKIAGQALKKYLTYRESWWEWWIWKTEQTAHGQVWSETITRRAKPLAKGSHMSTCFAKVNERPSNVSREENDFTWVMKIFLETTWEWIWTWNIYWNGIIIFHTRVWNVTVALVVDGMLGILEAFLEVVSIFGNLSEEDQSRSNNKITLHFSD